jgi:hypothetical protein
MPKRKRYLERFDKKKNEWVRVNLDTEEINEEVMMIYDLMEAQLQIELRKQEMLMKIEKEENVKG